MQPPTECQQQNLQQQISRCSKNSCVCRLESRGGTDRARQTPGIGPSVVRATTALWIPGAVAVTAAARVAAAAGHPAPIVPARAAAEAAVADRPGVVATNAAGEVRLRVGAAVRRLCARTSGGRVAVGVVAGPRLGGAAALAVVAGVVNNLEGSGRGLFGHTAVAV